MVLYIFNLMPIFPSKAVIPIINKANSMDLIKPTIPKVRLTGKAT